MDPRPTLLVVFHRADCPRFGGFISAWNALAHTREVRVLGVPLHRSQEEPLRAGPVLRQADFPFRPGLAPAVEMLLLRMGYRRTPVAVLLDTAGRPRLVVPAEERENACLRAIDLVRAHVPFGHGPYEAP